MKDDTQVVPTLSRLQKERTASYSQLQNERTAADEIKKMAEYPLLKFNALAVAAMERKEELRGSNAEGFHAPQ